MKNITHRLIDILGAFFIFIVATHVAFAQPITQGLVAYYPLDGDAYDHSGNGNHGSLFGGITFVAGRFGQAANFAAYIHHHSYMQLELAQA